MSVEVVPVTDEWARQAHIDNDAYLKMYAQSVEDPESFWGEHGKRLTWMKPYTRVKNTSYDPHNVSIKWYEDGTLNVSANCIDRHLATRVATRPRSSGKATTRPIRSASPTRSCTRSLQDGECDSSEAA
jgi:phosphate-selective porin